MTKNIDEIKKRYSAVDSEEAVNIITNNRNALEFGQTHKVRFPELGEFIAIDESNITKVKEICNEAKKVKYSYAELLLGLASLFLGAFFSAIISKVDYGFHSLSIFFYTFCPAAGVGCGVAYLFYRNKIVIDIKQFALRIEDAIDSTVKLIDKVEK